MPERIIIADASCLIALQNIKRLELLKALYSQISITPEVENEFGEALPDWIQIEAIKDVQKKSILQLELDEGEASAIVLALESTDSLLIIDERKGRKTARKLGVKIIGTLGVIILAREHSIIAEVAPILEALENVGFRISVTLKESILKKVGE